MDPRPKEQEAEESFRKTASGLQAGSAARYNLCGKLGIALGSDRDESGRNWNYGGTAANSRTSMIGQVGVP
jgi:hypothetical protein